MPNCGESGIIGASRPPGAREAGLQPYRLWGLRGPTPRGPLLDAQKRTEKPLEPKVPDLPLGAALWADLLGGGFTGIWWNL